MSPRTDLIRSIRAAREYTAKIAAEKTLAGEQISDDVTRLKDYDKLIEALDDTSKANWIAAFAIGCLCLIVASFAWALRISSINVHVSVETDAVTIQLARNWQSRGAWPLGNEPFRLDGLGDIMLPPELAPESSLQDRAWLDVNDAQVTLSNLELGAASKVSVLQASPSTAHLLSAGGPIRGQVHVRGAASIRGGNGGPSQPTLSKTIELEVPATFPFYGDGAGAVPAQLRFGTKEKVVMRDIPVRALSFSREETGAALPPVFVSGISSGTVTIRETAEKITLNDADQLHLGPLEGTIRTLEIGPKSLKISFEGTSNAVAVGAAGFEQNKVPTWLNYLYHQERLGFFWGSIALLWSVLWSAKQFLFK